MFSLRWRTNYIIFRKYSNHLLIEPIRDARSVRLSYYIIENIPVAILQRFPIAKQFFFQHNLFKLYLQQAKGRCNKLPVVSFNWYLDKYLQKSYNVGMGYKIRNVSRRRPNLMFLQVLSSVLKRCKILCVLNSSSTFSDELRQSTAP